MAGPPSTADSATAPLGGCMQRSANMKAIDTPKAKAAAMAMSLIKSAKVTPTTAAIVLPPIIDQGCAKGLAGTANNKTAEAPIGAIKNGNALEVPIR